MYIYMYFHVMMMCCSHNRLYHIQHLRGPIKLIATMLEHFYGLYNCTLFRLRWEPLVHHITTHDKVFNGDQIFYINLRDVISLVKNDSTSRKPKMYMYDYLLDVMCAYFTFLFMN
jgi:hypothetical protein